MHKKVYASMFARYVVVAVNTLTTATTKFRLVNCEKVHLPYLPTFSSIKYDDDDDDDNVVATFQVDGVEVNFTPIT